MKKLLIMAVIGAVAATMAQAGSSCCPSAKAKAAKADAKECDVDFFSKLDLSEDQQAKVAELKASLGDGEWDKEGCSKYKESLHEILTAEQIDKCKSICEEKGWSCPSVDKKSSEETTG